MKKNVKHIDDKELKKSIEKGIIDADFNRIYGGLAISQAIFLGFAIGGGFESPLIGLGTGIVLLCMLFNKITRIIFSIAASAFWGYFVYWYNGNVEWGIVVFIIAIIVNLAAMHSAKILIDQD